jgi:hypothetical protein
MTKEKLQDYISKDYSSYDIARAENKGQTTIRYWLKKHNLKTEGDIRYQKIIKGKINFCCGACKEYKPIDNFYKKTKDTYHSYCKNCFNEYVKQRWKDRKLKSIEYKGGKCSSCGYNKCPNVLEFHHRDPTQKEFEGKELRQMSWDKVIKELDKCDLLCSNCHRERHYEIFSLNNK